MPRRARQAPRAAKVDALRATRTLNRRAAQIQDPLFGTHDFFDARDLVQVKYEMLRRVENGQAVAPTAAAFQVSRPSCYQMQRTFQPRGLTGLLPKKRGPHGGHTLTAAIIAFLRQARTRDASLRPPALAQQVADRFGTTVHPRTIARALARPEKKRRR